MTAPEEHIAPKVPVVTTSTSLYATFMPLLSTRSLNSVAVKTLASPSTIFLFMSEIVLLFLFSLLLLSYNTSLSGVVSYTIFLNIILIEKNIPLENISHVFLPYSLTRFHVFQRKKHALVFKIEDG